MSNLVRYDPFTELARMERAMDRFFEDMMLSSSWPELYPTRSLLEPLIDPYRFPGDNLAVDMIETDDAIVVKASLAGVSPDNIDIEERDGVLTIRAKSAEEEKRSGMGWRIRERRMGLWQRSLRLPVEVKGDKAEAEYKDGVLTVTLPKVRGGKRLANRIPVKLPKLSLPKFGKKEPQITIHRN
jgi:HSP20 family protein